MDFLWGAATSSHQVEGNNDKNDWWAWEQEGHVEGGAKSGLATDHWNRFREDIRLAADLGLNSYRFSVEWSRIEPEEGRWDDRALEWYRELISECEKQKIVPMLTLHHFTSPQWFARKGSFTWSEAPTRFTEYVKHVIQALGSRVSLWCTFNEPMVLVVGTYLAKFMPPAEFSPAKASAACRNLLDAHVQAYDLLHAELRDRPISVGIAQNLLDFEPDRAWHPLEQLFAHLLHRFYNQSWLDAVTARRQGFGIPGLIPKAPVVSRAREKPSADFIGVNYYTKAYVQWRPRSGAEGISPDSPVGIAFARRKEKVSDLGWAIHPEGFGKMLRFASRYRLPIYITENGIADREDRLRREFLDSHLREVAQAIEGGIDIRGYYYWSLLDNFEWIKGFWPRFGLYSVDYGNFERKARESALHLKKILSAHRTQNAKGWGMLPPKADLLK